MGAPRLALAIFLVGAWTPEATAPVTTHVARILVGWPARTVLAHAAPFAVATEMGWFREEGIEVELVPLAGSGDVVRNVVLKEVLFGLASPEPVAIARTQGVRAKTFYTAYQGNIFLIAVPADSPTQKLPDLKGKTIGVPSMGSNGVLVARALAASAGLNPEKDITVVAVGEAAQAAVMLRNKQVDALSQSDAQHVRVESAGVKLRMLDNKDIARFPSDGFVALEETLQIRRKAAIGLARGYAKGTVFTIANPEAAVRLLYEVFPQTKPTGKDETSGIDDDLKILEARIPNWKLERSGATRWGEYREANYAAYLDLLRRSGVIKEKVEVREIVTHEMLDEINRFDADRIAAEARAFRPGKSLGRPEAH